MRFGLENPLADEGIKQLTHIALRHRPIQAVGGLYLPSRQMKTPEQRIQEGQLRGEIPVPGLPVVTMMPVMKFRRNKQEAQRTKSHPNIGVNKKRLPLMEHGIDANCPFGETQRQDRYQRDPLG